LLIFPQIEGGKGVQDAICAGYTKTFAIADNISDEKKEAALAFVKHMTSKEAGKRYLEEGTWITAIKVANPDTTKLPSLFLQALEERDKASQAWMAYGDWVTPGLYDAMSKVAQSMITNSATVEETTKNLENARLEFQFEQ